MKFAKELDHDLVPEWRAKYLNYKLGKKKLKAIEIATNRNANRKTSISSRRPSFARRRYSNDHHTVLHRTVSTDVPAETHEPLLGHSPLREPTTPRSNSYDKAPPVPNKRKGQMTRYGSIIGSPPRICQSAPRAAIDDVIEPVSLPGPALDVHKSTTPRNSTDTIRPIRLTPNSPLNPKRSVSMGHPYTTIADGRSTGGASPKPQSSLRPLARRILSLRPRRSTLDTGGKDFALEHFRDIDVRTAEFFFFLDTELDKIETFYHQKELEATSRLKTLREQLHIMRDQRVAEIIAFREAQRRRKSRLDPSSPQENMPLLITKAKIRTKQLLGPVDEVWDKAHLGRVGATFKAMRALGTPTGPVPQDGHNMDHRDYARKAAQYDVTYRAAKQRLKTALAEYYRGLELLKSYAMVNRTAFRKINKKYDKTVNARPPGRYMLEKINKAKFVNNDLLDSHIYAVEDLYARYFEKGDRKTAIGKLRVKAVRAGEYSANSFRSGLMLATGLVFGIEGLVKALNQLGSPDPRVVTETVYLLQIYGGYFLMLVLALMFCLACRVWKASRVNYQFIFEFDTRHTLDWRQLSEIPCLLGLILGLTLWINFNAYGGRVMYLYWPVILIGVATLIIFAPLPFFYHRSRSWLVTSLWRLSLAGLYPVQFRDFFLGDLFCSQTYALGNLELFFCLYAQSPIWADPSQCNSSHSRLLGFFSCLPGVWRALQCVRRFYDTKNTFPHLVNCGKYMFTILYYMTLSLYRISPRNSYMAAFITFATINAVYTSIWDIVMDWSLLDPHAKHKFLRNMLAYESTWPYYTAMVIDPIIRFNWILYAVYTHDLQHSTKIAFIVGLTEVFRRGVWLIFRVENEHCSNVGRFRASRDVPLPYNIERTPSPTSSRISLVQDHRTQEPQEHTTPQRPDSVMREDDGHAGGHGQATGMDLERAHTQGVTNGSSSSLRRRRQTMPQVVSTFRRVGQILRTAHAQDFERRRRPEAGNAGNDGDDDDDDEDDEDEEDLAEASRELDEAMQVERGPTQPEAVDDAAGELRSELVGSERAAEFDGGRSEPEEPEEPDGKAHDATVDQVGRDDRDMGP